MTRKPNDVSTTKDGVFVEKCFTMNKSNGSSSTLVALVAVLFHILPLSVIAFIPSNLVSFQKRFNGKDALAFANVVGSTALNFDEEPTRYATTTVRCFSLKISEK
jgi:hypothetical protein